MKWNDINPIYRIDSRLVDGRDAQELHGVDNPVCASVRVYQVSPEEYTTFITPEAYRALMEHAAEHEGKIGRVLKPDDPVFTKKQKYGTPVDGNTMSCWMSRLVQKAGVRNAHTKKSRRYNVPDSSRVPTLLEQDLRRQQDRQRARVLIDHEGIHDRAQGRHADGSQLLPDKRH